MAAQERKNQTELQTERFMKPNAHTVTDPSKANFDAIGDDGMPIRGNRVRSTRVPEIGDKVQSRHAQKGCVFSDWIYLRAIQI